MPSASFVLEETKTHELGHSSPDDRTCYTTKRLYDGRKERERLLSVSEKKKLLNVTKLCLDERRHH